MENRALEDQITRLPEHQPGRDSLFVPGQSHAAEVVDSGGSR
jgi:hypothetical protein